MKFLIISSDYSYFLHWLYDQHPGLEKQSYGEQMRVRAESFFGIANYYSSNLNKLGHEALDVYANNEFIQKAWVMENGLKVEQSSKLGRQYRNVLQQGTDIAAKTPLRYLKFLFRPMLRSLDSRQSWFYNILAAQIKMINPDILLNLTMSTTSTAFLTEMKPYTRLLVGQHAATTLPHNEDYGCYDLIVSSFPATIDYFSHMGIPTKLYHLGFESTVLDKLKDDGETVAISFVGSLFNVHRTRITLLETLCSRFKQMRIWGPSVDHLPQDSVIRKRYEGQAWGLNMFQILRNSQITLNHHGDVAPYANNSRMYEATGVGTLLITDWKENLHEMFEPRKEVVAYRTPEECSEHIEYYLEHDDERKAIAHAGKDKTLREHTYHHRMEELVNIVKNYL